MVTLAKPARSEGLGSRGTPERTRAAILDAALREFAQEGLAGARTDSIARQARVNKALLHYYFQDKETLYGAALEHVFARLSARMLEVLNRDLPPKQKILAYAGAHFDFIAASPIYPRLVQREMMRAGRHGSPHIDRIVKLYLRPVEKRVAEVLHHGIAAGEFRKIHPVHFILSVVAMNVFYFSSVPFIQVLFGKDPLAPRLVAERRAAVLDLISAGLFKHGARNSATEFLNTAKGRK